MRRNRKNINTKQRIAKKRNFFKSRVNRNNKFELLSVNSKYRRT